MVVKRQCNDTQPSMQRHHNDCNDVMMMVYSKSTIGRKLDDIKNENVMNVG